MRALTLSLAATLLLAACQPAARAPADAGGSAPAAAPPTATAAPTAAPSPEARMARWEREWEASKLSLAVAREEAAATGTSIPPEIDRQVTDLLDRSIGEDQDEAARIEELQDAVSDALRLAEILSVG